MKNTLFLSLLFFSFLLKGNHLLIIDIANNDPYIYRSLFNSASELGMNTQYQHFYAVTPEEINDANPIVLALDGTFFLATAQELSLKHTIKSPMLKHIYTILDQLSNQKNKTIMILLPNSGNPGALLALTQRLLGRLKISEKRNMVGELDSFLRQALTHILKSDASKSSRYDTSLLYAKKNNELLGLNNDINIIHDKYTDEILAAPLPLHSTIFQNTTELQPAYPLGFYVKNRSTNNQFFVVSNSAIKFADINDPFAYNPVDQLLRKKLLEGMYQLLGEFNAAHNNQKLTLQSENHFPPVKNEDSSIFEKSYLDKRYEWTSKGIACGWLGIAPYKSNEEGITHLLQSGLTMLWLQLNPEWYLSKNAVNKAGKDAFFNEICQFTAALKKKAHELDKPIPKLFVGMEITGNLSNNPPEKAAKDIYGKVYTKIPAPLDYQTFWKTELIEPLEQFSSAWNTSIGNGIPLAGVFLDFEMYHAPDQTGQFLTLMDFSESSWQAYIKGTNKEDLEYLKSTKEKVAYLLKHSLFPDYFSFLQQSARKLGKKLKEEINTILPEGIIAGYNITLPHSWFYKGIMAGLSSSREPLILATFNNEFSPHHAWLKANNIHLLHLPVLLLSKFQSTEDFKKIAPLWKAHSGIWFNRISRLEESRSLEGKAWDFGLETSPLDTKTVIFHMNKWLKQLAR